jgi:hypothetical protein
MITLTIPKASVVVEITSSYSLTPLGFLNTNFKQISFSTKGEFRLSSPGNTWLSIMTAW